MKTQQFLLSAGGDPLSPPPIPIDAQLALVFAGASTLESPALVSGLQQRYPKAHIVFVSAPDNIAGSDVLETGGSVTAVRFDSASIRAVAENLGDRDDSERAGEALARKLPVEELAHVLIFSEGLNVNGTALLRGLKNVLGGSISLSGGLASDGEDFKRTLVGLDASPRSGQAVAVGLYGNALRIGKGSLGGWIPFGEVMKITRSEANVAFELDGRPALDVYKKLLGKKAYALPASGLLFPLSIQAPAGGDEVVRTLLSVDESAGSVSFAGDVPEGYSARVMQADLDQLIDASGAAATAAAMTKLSETPASSLVLLISCIGRKLVLQRRASEEILAARHALALGAAYAGFYSYGEISPANGMLECQLHNQTMTITRISEIP